MDHRVTVFSVLLAVATAGGCIAQELDRPGSIIIPDPPADEPSADLAEKLDLLKRGELFPPITADSAKASTPAIARDFIVFGYAHSYGGSNTLMDHLRWESLTHVGTTFIAFDNTGTITNPSSFTGRDATLRVGGAAQASGVKVIMVAANMVGGDFDVSIIDTVMTSSAARTTLVNQIANLIKADAYCQGVSFDFEPFAWSAAARDGMTLFFNELRTALPPPYEISLYGDPSPNTTQWDIPGIEPNLDYLLYSGYDFGTGNAPHAITDHNSGIAQMGNFYFVRGLPPRKLVSVISSYGRRWEGTSAYDVTGVKASSIGFTDGLWETTLTQRNSGPHAYRYQRGDEGAWYTYNDGVGPITTTWDSPESLEYKVRHARSFEGSSNYGGGAQLGGVGFWSLMWLAETSSANPGSTTTTAKTRTYPQVFQICQEALAPPGTTRFIATGFEGLDFRWRDPNESLDTTGDTDNDSARSLVAAPAGTGRPTSTTNAMQARFDFEGTGAKRGFFRYEILAHQDERTIIDTNAMIAKFDSTTAVGAHIHQTAAYSGYTVRLVVMDADRELELSPSFTLNTTGWRRVEWNLTDAASVTAHTTSELGFRSGDGVIDSAGAGARDIGFVGFLVQGTGAADVRITLDEVTYEHRNFGGRVYTINEFSHPGNSGEFVEIHGTPGVIPTGVELRSYAGTTGDIFKSIALGGLTVPASGLLVVGDPDVPSLGSSAGFSISTNDLDDGTPGGLQIVHGPSGGVYDSVVYGARGGVQKLVRVQTLGVTGEGYPWLGGIAAGGGNFGRWRDGLDSNRNHFDFAVVRPSPGLVNEASGFGSTDFTTLPAWSWFGFPWASAGSVNAGVTSSPNGGRVFRCADVSGGNMAYFGNPALGADGDGYRVTGQLYIPAAGEPAQALGLGICVTQGSTFFATSANTSGYENGYWLLFQNRAGAATGDGLGEYAGTFHFAHATNDGRDAQPASSLGSRTLAQLGVTAGAWTTFELTINPRAAAGSQLVARIGGSVVYTGAIPSGGPTQGSFAIGHRENHAGNNASNEGTWIDALNIAPLTAGPTGVVVY